VNLGLVGAEDRLLVERGVSFGVIFKLVGGFLTAGNWNVRGRCVWSRQGARDWGMAKNFWVGWNRLLHMGLGGAT